VDQVPVGQANPGIAQDNPAPMPPMPQTWQMPPMPEQADSATPSANEPTAIGDGSLAQPEGTDNSQVGDIDEFMQQAIAESMATGQPPPGQARGVKRKRSNGRTVATGVQQDQPQQANATTYQANAAPMATANIAQAQPAHPGGVIDLTGDDE